MPHETSPPTIPDRGRFCLCRFGTRGVCFTGAQTDGIVPVVLPSMMFGGLSLVMLRYIDETTLASFWKWVARSGAPSAAEPNGLMNLAYVGALFLAAAVLTLGVGLIGAARRMAR
jgi:hypothetical protein